MAKQRATAHVAVLRQEANLQTRAPLLPTQTQLEVRHLSSVHAMMVLSKRKRKKTKVAEQRSAEQQVTALMAIRSCGGRNKTFLFSALWSKINVSLHPPQFHSLATHSLLKLLLLQLLTLLIL